MKKILFVLDLYKPHIWGVEILFENIITRLAEQGNQLVILTSRYDKNLAHFEENKNIEIHRVGHNRYDFMLYSVFPWIKLATSCDLIHTTTYNSAIPASIIGFFSKKKVILTVHEIFGKLWYRFMWIKWFFFKLFESFIFKFPFDKYICVSNYTKNSLRIYFWIPDKKLITIYNWIDYNFWDKNNFQKEKYFSIRKDLWLENNFVWLFYWRPGISKWLEFYIKAIPEIIKAIPNFKALIIVPDSKNNPFTPIQELIDRMKLQTYIYHIPGVSNKELPNYILLSDFVVIPSLAEWFGFAVAEVSALWQKLIASDVAAIPEVATGKINFVNAWDVEDIAKKIIDFKKNKYKNIPEKRFDWKNNIEAHLTVYNDL